MGRLGVLEGIVGVVVYLFSRAGGARRREQDTASKESKAIIECTTMGDYIEI
jgi:hypothetical protein